MAIRGIQRERRFSVTEITFHVHGSGVRRFYQESRSHWYPTWTPELSAMPFLANLVQPVGERPEEEQEESLNF